MCVPRPEGDLRCPGAELLAVVTHQIWVLETEFGRAASTLTAELSLVPQVFSLKANS